MSALVALLGGLGPFLLGTSLMTEGLKLAAGNALRAILATWTRSPLRGLMAGFLITAAVRSSSAVTVAAIGFVNAGLLTLTQAVWVVFGTNAGTTTTAWLVAFVGMRFDIAAPPRWRNGYPPPAGSSKLGERPQHDPPAHAPERAHPSSLCNPPNIGAKAEQALLMNGGI